MRFKANHNKLPKILAGSDIDQITSPKVLFATICVFKVCCFFYRNSKFFASFWMYDRNLGSVNNFSEVCTKFSQGKTHNSKLFKDSKLSIGKNVKLFGGSGYQGLGNFHLRTRKLQKIK
ncbi:MAG: hypothetical protein LBH37_02925 [Oscillospiraceae bacterium]|jgi:hypothetical protein|nr:hypothetical protein [Oscillospiraceae bacterium]